MMPQDSRSAIISLNGGFFHEPTGAITVLLRKVSDGDRQAEEELFGAVYGELKRIARAALAGERPNHSLNPTALVNEAFIRVPRRDLGWRDRTHFYSVCARAMRRILVDHARQTAAQKRPHPRQRIEYDEGSIFIAAVSENPEQYIAIDAALTELARIDPKLSEVVELRFLAA